MIKRAVVFYIKEEGSHFTEDRQVENTKRGNIRKPWSRHLRGKGVKFTFLFFLGVLCADK